MKSGKKWLALLVVVLVVAGVGGFFTSRGAPKFKTDQASRGEIVSTINATGTVQAVKTVPAGLSLREAAPVVSVSAAVNEEVKTGKVLAEVNTNPGSDYAKVICPIDGIVIERRVEQGETLDPVKAPAMFTIAQDLKKEVNVFASIDEADIGLIKNAKLTGQPVSFTVEAYRDQLFQGNIREIRVNPTVQQSVTSYPVVVLAPNPEMKLLPGMTAKLSFQVDKRENAVRVPNAALRFYPKPYMVHPSDRRILEGTDEPAAQTASSSTTDTRSASQRVEERKKGDLRYVWVQEGQWLRAVEVTTGLKDNKYTELLSGDVAPGKELVTGL